MNKQTVTIVAFFILFIVTLLGVVYINELLFVLHGYSADIGQSQSAEAHTAYHKIAPYKRPFVFSVVLLGVVTSYLADRYLKGNKSVLVNVVFYLSVVFTVILALIFAVGSIIPSRVV